MDHFREEDGPGLPTFSTWPPNSILGSPLTARATVSLECGPVW
jgi:hypothetical protein